MGNVFCVQKTVLLFPLRFTDYASRMTFQENADGLSAVALAKAGGFFHYFLYQKFLPP
jgi:hypothetical protein